MPRQRRARWIRRVAQWPLALPYSLMKTAEPLYLQKTDATMHAAGGMFATSGDLATFLLAQLPATKSALPAAVITKSQQAQVSTDSSYGAGPFTVFAPSDEAFKAVPAATLAYLGCGREQLELAVQVVEPAVDVARGAHHDAHLVLHPHGTRERAQVEADDGLLHPVSRGGDDLVVRWHRDQARDLKRARRGLAPSSPRRFFLSASYSW